MIPSTQQHRFPIATLMVGFALLVCFSSSPCEASFVRMMGFNREASGDNLDMEQVFRNFDHARRLQKSESRKLQASPDGFVEVGSIEAAAEDAKAADHDHGDGDEEHFHADAFLDEIASNFTLEDPSSGILQVLEEAVVDLNETDAAEDDDANTFFNFDPPDLDEEETAATEEVVAETEAAETEELVEEVIQVQPRDDPEADATSTGPRGSIADASPQIQETEISFMIIMEDFAYSNNAETLDEITLGTKFGFTGRIATKAEDLGSASGSCTVTSGIKKELSYCDIYHKIETDNFGGFGSVVVAGTADEVGGRFLVTGTGGSLQSSKEGYAMVQFDPAGNPVLYVLLKLY